MFCTIVLTMDVEGSPLPELEPAAPPPLPKSARRAQSIAMKKPGALAGAARRGKGGRKAKTVGDAPGAVAAAARQTAVLAAARKSGERRGRDRALSGGSSLQGSLQGSLSGSPSGGSTPSGGTPPQYSSGSGAPSPLASPTVQARRGSARFSAAMDGCTSPIASAAAEECSSRSAAAAAAAGATATAPATVPATTRATAARVPRKEKRRVAATRARALYDWTGEEAGDLTLSQDDIVVVVPNPNRDPEDSEDDAWRYGYVWGSGDTTPRAFPATFVEAIGARESREDEVESTPATAKC